MKDWILEDEVVALVCCDDLVYFYKTNEKQTTINAVKREYKYSTAPYLLTLNNKDSEFKLKIKNGALFVKSKNLPDPNKYYTVGNYNKPYLLAILEEVTSTFGDISGTFEIAFREEFSGECFPVSTSMSFWKEIIAEQKRRLFANCNSKTTKFVVGHRYDREDISIIYLGSFFAFREVNRYPDQVKKFQPVSTDQIHLFTTDTETTYKTVTEVITNKRIIPINSIKNANAILQKDEDYVVATKKISPMVDSGKVLVDDTSQITQDDLINKCIDTYVRNNESQDYPQYNSVTYYNNLEELYSIFTYLGLSSTLNYNQKIGERLEAILNSNLTRLTQIIPINTTNETVLSGTYKGYLEDCSTFNSKFLFNNNVFTKEFLDTLSKFYKINISSLSLNVTRMFIKERPNYNKDLNSLIDHISFYLLGGRYGNDGGIIALPPELAKKNVNEQIDKALRKAPSLAQAVKDALTKRKCNTYFVRNIGTLKKPLMKTSIRIDIFDIFELFGGRDSLPEEVEKDIVSLPFIEIIIEYLG